MKNSRCSAFLRCTALFLTVLFLCMSAGCSQIGNIVSAVAAPGEFPVEVNGVTVAARPQKVVVISPCLADVILALGCETQLAAASEECTQSALRSLTKVNGNDPEELLASLTPDLVLAESFTDEMTAVLSSNNVPMLAIAPATDREDFERLYAQVSSALTGGGPGYDAGIQTAQDVFITLDDINRIVPKEKVHTACYLYDLDGSAVTGDMLGSTIMSYAGVTNVFKSQQGGAYDFEALRMSNPDNIFCVPGLKSQIESDSRFRQLSAVQAGKVTEMDPSLMEWQGRTVVTAAYEISAACFPELLEENSMAVTDPTKDIDSQVSSMLASSSAPTEDNTRYETLREGDNGEDVLAMQTRLEELGYLDVEYDGHYGSYTAGCVQEFQRVNGLEETGVANHETQRLLYSKAAKAKEASSAPAE